MSAQDSNGVAIVGKGPPPLEGTWVIVSDGRRDYVGRADKAAVLAAEQGAPLALEPAYEFFVQPITKVHEHQGVTSNRPIGESVYYATPLSGAFDDEHSRTTIVRPTSIERVDATHIRKRVAGVVQFAEGLRREAQARRNIRPLVITATD